jgi:alkanesulfonate monooxygenase SsuD/methylene tetrahydromethanopterin reductase-like flavin-dependent oxidoreductase (luciferase family)
MKVGVLQFFSWPERRVSLATVYPRALERIEVMDKVGFDAVWLAEHHFSSFSVCPSVHMVGTLAAARTKRLRIGTAVSLAAFYHPLRLAEEVALLDVLSGGRVNWGAGRGFAPVEFNAFGVPTTESAERFREAVEIVLQAWAQERLTYRGAHYSFENLEVLPKPLQTPLPVWMAASSDPAIEWAAAQGHSILMDPHSTFADIGRKRRFYAERMRAAGHRDQGRDIPMARLMAVAATREQAEAVARRGAGWIVGAYSGPQHQKVTYAPPRDYKGLEPVDYYLKHVIIHGTPDAVLDQIHGLEAEIGLNYLMCAPLSHETFTLLAEKVVPKLI